MIDVWYIFKFCPLNFLFITEIMVFVFCRDIHQTKCMCGDGLERRFCVGVSVDHLVAPWSPRSRGCSSSSQSPGNSAEAGAPSPAGPSRCPPPGFSPAARGSSSPAGSWTWPSRCGSSSASLPCPTRLAEGRWPLPSVNQNRGPGREKFKVLSFTIPHSVCV